MLNTFARPSRGNMLAGMLGTEQPGLPGPISGYGGGTWNLDGSVATPVDQPPSMPEQPRVTRREIGAGQVGPSSAPAAPPSAGHPDYAAMLAQAVGPALHMSTVQKIASIVGPALMAASGNQAGASHMIEMLQNRRDDYARRQQEAALTGIKWQREDQLHQDEQNKPQFFSGNEDRVRYDPTTGTSQRVYDAPHDFEDYAATSGFEPGSPEYMAAAKDYVLRGNGPSAFQHDRDLEALRNAGRMSLEHARQQGRTGLEAVRQGNRVATRGTPSYRDLHPAPHASSRSDLPVVNSPDEAMRLAPGTKFRTPDGAVKVRP